MNLTGWSKSLEVTADGEGIVSHAGLALLRQLVQPLSSPFLVAVGLAGYCSYSVRWTMAAVSYASSGVPVYWPLLRIASS